MMQSTSTTNNFVPKDLISRNNIYYLVSDVLQHEELGMNDVITKYKMRTVISTNYAADPLWAKLQTYDPITHEPIPRKTTNIADHTSTSSSVESYSPKPRQEIPTKSTTSTPSIPTRVETVPTIPTTTTTTTTSQPQSQQQQSTTSNVSIPSIGNAHLSSPVPTPHIAKSFRSPPPSDYFVNNAATLSYLSVSQFFKLPLHEACVALRVDESSLKKRCRELGIRRWPYRKRCNIPSGKGNTQEKAEETTASSSGDQLFSCFQLNKGKGSPVVQKMKSEEALALEVLDKLHNVNRSTNATPTQSTTTTSSTSTPSTSATVQQPPTNQGVVSHQPPRPVPQQPTPGTTAYSYPPYPYPHMYPPHPGYHYPYGVPPPPTHDGSQPVPYPMYYPPQNSVPPPGVYPPPPTESKDGQPQQPPYVPPYYYDYRYPYPPPQSGTVPPYPYPPQPGYSYPPHPEQGAYPYPPHGYPMAYPPQMGYPPQPVPPPQQPQQPQPQQQVPKPVIVSTSPAESQPLSGTPCRTVSSSASGDQTPTTPVGSPQTKMVYQRETKVLHQVRYKPPSPTETTAEIAAKIKRERLEEQEEAAKKVRRDIQIANPTCSKPVSNQTVQNGALKVADK